MGIYGEYAHRLMENQNDSNNLCNFIIESTVYNEYENRKLMLENCINEDNKVILEAQVKVLCEVAIKDIISKVKEAFNKLKEFVKKIWGIILEKVGKIKEKIKEFRNNRKEKSSVKDFEHDDRVRKLIEESSVVQYKIGNEEKYVGYFFESEIFTRMAYDTNNLIQYFNWDNDARNIIDNNLDLKSNNKYKELEIIKRKTEKIEIEYVPVTEYNGKFTKYIKSSDNLDDLLKLSEMYSDIIDAIENDILDITESERDINKAMGNLQKRIDSFEKESENYKRSSENFDSDHMKNKYNDSAERSKKIASVYISLMSLVKEINNDFLGAANKFNSASINILSQSNKIYDFIDNFVKS